MKIAAAMLDQMIDRQPSFAREIGRILEISLASIQETNPPQRP